MASTRVNSSGAGQGATAPWAATSSGAATHMTPGSLRPAEPSAPSSHSRSVGLLTEGWQLAALKWHLLINTLTRSTWILVGTILGALYLLFVVSSLVFALFQLGGQSVEVMATVSVLGGVALMLGWWVIPVVSSRADASLDPSRLAPFPLRIPGIQAGQLLGAVIGVPGAVTVVLVMGWVSSWRFSTAALAVAVPCALLGLVLTFAGSRTVTALSANLSRHRRVGEILSIMTLVLLVLLGPIIMGVVQGLGQVWQRLPQWASYLAWTPLGAVWAIPGDVARGQWLPALARLLITAVTILAVLFVWSVALRRVLSDASGGAAASSSRWVSDAGLFDRLPATEWAAVMARCLIYWFKDPRYSASLVMIPALGAVVWFTSAGVFSGAIWMLPALVALLLAYTISADVAYDNTAFTLHILAPVKGSHDRLGRVLALLVIGVPLVAIALTVAMVRTQGWHLLPGMVGLCAALLLAGAGVMSIVSARYTYPVAPPGASPLKTPQGFTVLNVLFQFVTMGVVAVLGGPVLVLLLMHAGSGEALWGWLALAVGVLEGLGFLWLGVVVGGKWLDERAPELLQEVARYR